MSPGFHVLCKKTTGEVGKLSPPPHPAPLSFYPGNTGTDGDELLQVSSLPELPTSKHHPNPQLSIVSKTQNAEAPAAKRTVEHF
ncbi:uncharacterized protein CLUP02_01573 [Colletotrichum lupini]|uniref:Uncharacterized protein n=1 Tax=Colletotrichum lupini TaxID=145971 RepID=A0A9Q8SDC0_9PEZI|nr:uncharacterized protein CLUP02_01573 [Colletotrichum lupini]UQC74920.1 hypothetical protein CLUP02_01573 [Colletotrichum lupini]